MPFEEWPDILDECPTCERANCATYQGYYQRTFHCTELEFFGKLVIRTFYCQHFKTRYSLIPSFVTPHRIVSSATIDQLFIAYKEFGSVFKAIEHVCGDLADHFYLPISTVSKLLREQNPRPP